MSHDCALHSSLGDRVRLATRMGNLLGLDDVALAQFPHQQLMHLRVQNRMVEEN